MQCEPLKQGPERLAVLVVVESGQYLVLGGAQPLAEFAEESPAAHGGHDPPGPAVGRIRPPLDQADLGQAVQQVSHHRPVDAQMLGQRKLAAVLVPGRRGEHLVAARAAGHIREGSGHGLHVGP